MNRKSWILSIAAGLLLAACVRVPAGPNVMVLPGTGKNFEQFQVDDAVCRQWAAQQTGLTVTQASTETAASGAAIGTVLGAAGGAAVGAASGSPATGAAVGAGAGLLGGAAAGASSAEGVQWSVQRRYDMAYMQCMYAKGNQIPIPGGSRPSDAPTWQRAGESPSASEPVDVPPPPAGTPPPPPPGRSR